MRILELDIYIWEFYCYIVVFIFVVVKIVVWDLFIKCFDVIVF